MDNRKQKLIPILIFSAVFLVCIFVFNYIFIGRNSSVIVETSEATLPVLSVQVGKNHVNQMYGHTSDMDKNLLRDSIVPLETSYEFSVIMSESSMDIASVSYTIYETNNKDVREEGIASFQKKKNQIRADVTLKNRLQTGKVYLMELVLETENGVPIHYYTRVKYGTELHFTECMDFIQKFHDAALEGGTEGNAYISQFLEPNESYLNNDLSQVDLYSNNDIVCYAGMKPMVEKSYPAKVKEITEDLSSVEMQYILSYETSEGEKQYYMVTEYYKVRYTVSRMYLLGYQRQQEQYFRFNAIDASNNRFYIGTTASTQKDLHTQNDCEMAAFVQGNQLWYYDFQAGEMIRVFSFIGEDYRDRRNNHKEHEIDILNMDKKGNLTFVVYGYMNRGAHEGENGICVYRFHYDDRTNEEVVFIPTEIPYENMKKDISKLAYLNKANSFYFYLDGSVYKVDSEHKTDTVVESELTADQVVSSETGYLAIAKDDKIEITYMEDDGLRTVHCGDNETVRTIGFIESDFIYGVADQSKIKKRADGTVITPMKEIRIIDHDLQQIKNYKKSDIYIMDAAVEGNVVKMKRATPSGSGYRYLVDDFIHYKQEDAEKITFEYSYLSDLYNQLYMTFPTYVYVTEKPKLVTTKEQVSGNYTTIDFKNNEERAKECYVYAQGALKGTYTSVKEAIAAAKEGAGVVVNSRQSYIWEKGVAKGYAKVPNVGIVKAKKKSESLAACMQMLLKLDAQSVEYADLAKEEGSTDEIMSKYFAERAVNLSGCSLEDSLYFISEGRPLIAERKNGTYVVLMSYNSTKLRYIDPVKGESIQAERDDMEREFKKVGNHFYSYTE